MRCFVSSSPSPAPLTAVTATARRPPSTLPIVFPAGRCQHHQHCLRRQSTFTALHRRRGLAVVVRAHNHGGSDVQPPPLEEPTNHFAEETKLISRRFIQTFCTFEGYLYKEAIEMSVDVCLCAKKAVAMASQLEDSYRLTVCTPAPEPAHDEMTISPDTVHLTLGAFVDVFVQTAEDSYNRIVTTKTVTSFMDALRGLVCIGHILLDDALDALCRTHPRESLAEYAFNYDVKTMRHEFDWEMAHLEDGMKATTYSKQCELVLPTILQGVKATKSLLSVMAARRQRALEKANKVVP